MLVSERVTTTPRATSQHSPEIHLDFGESLVTSRPAAPLKTVVEKRSKFGECWDWHIIPKTSKPTTAVPLYAMKSLSYLDSKWFVLSPKKLWMFTMQWSIKPFFCGWSVSFLHIGSCRDSGSQLIAPWLLWFSEAKIYPPMVHDGWRKYTVWNLGVV